MLIVLPRAAFPHISCAAIIVAGVCRGDALAAAHKHFEPISSKQRTAQKRTLDMIEDWTTEVPRRKFYFRKGKVLS